MKELSILYQDTRLVAVNKPSGLLVHRTAIDRFERENAMHILRDQLGQWVYPVHRLDKATSGVLVFALDRETAGAMTDFFSRGSIRKNYLAVVRGYTKEYERIDHPLKEHKDKMTDRNALDGPAKPAVTDYLRLATAEIAVPVGRYGSARYSLIKASPLTGRKHQIRRHLKHIFHPVLGDTTYGDGRQNNFFRKEFDCWRLMLHASDISFPHPATGRMLRIEAPADNGFLKLLIALGWGGINTAAYAQEACIPSSQVNPG